MAYSKEQREAKKKLLEQQEKDQTVAEKAKTDEVKAASTEQPKPKKLSIRNIPLTTNVWVRSNCYGELIYISKRTGFEIRWDCFGSKQPVSLEELITLRNTQRKFFEKNWVVLGSFQDAEYTDVFSLEEILDFLQIKQYYKGSLCPDDIDDVFKLNTEQIEMRVPNMSSGVRNSIVVRANELITNGGLDSLRVISALEKSLNCELCRPE